MNAGRIRALVALELTQRVRSVAWYVLLGVFALVLLIVTALSFVAFLSVPETGLGVYSVIVMFVLLLAVLVSPTLSGNAINGDRDAATLAPVQVTLATTGEILAAKVLAAWITGLAFAAVAVPFVVVASIGGGVRPAVAIVSIVVLVVEIGVVAAIGVGLSGIIARPLFSIAATYLVVSALVIGTVIAFGLTGAAIRSEATSSYRYYEGTDWPPPANAECSEWQTSTYDVWRYDRVWWLLAPNPFVILADATPSTFDANGNAVDLFSQVKAGVRYAQVPPDLEMVTDDCSPTPFEDYPTAEETIASTTPSWFVGLALQLVLTGLLLWWAWARTRTPSRRLPPGTRIA